MSRMPKNQASCSRSQAATNERLVTDRNQTTRVNRRSDRVYQRYVEDRERHNAQRPAREPCDQDFQLTGRIAKKDIMSTQRFSPREMEMELRRYETWRSQRMEDTGRSTQRTGGAQRTGDGRRMEGTRHGETQHTRMNTTRATSEQVVRNELKANRLSKIMMYMTCALLMVLMFVQIGRLAQIAAQTKRISSINGSLREMDIERNNLEVRLSMQQNINNVKKAAIDKLGMVYPENSQIRVIALGQSDPSRTQTADNTGALEDMN